MDKHTYEPKLARELIVDELFDLSLYKGLLPSASPVIKKLLEHLIPVEARHYDKWQSFFGITVTSLDLSYRLKLSLLLFLCQLFGDKGTRVILAAIEAQGIQKYLSVWDHYQGTPLGEAVRDILHDELEHEDEVILQEEERGVSAERIYNTFLGFNDGLVEILGAVSGFFAAFHTTGAVLAASFTVTIAGALSMAAGAYVASSSEREVEIVDERKQRFLDHTTEPKKRSHPLNSAIIVGFTYMLGAAIPIVPIILGSTNIVATFIVGLMCVVLLSTMLAFLSGMNVWKRIVMNTVIIFLAVLVTYAIGLLAKDVFGLTI